jgi:hypothetical protein
MDSNFVTVKLIIIVMKIYRNITNLELVQLILYYRGGEKKVYSIGWKSETLKYPLSSTVANHNHL